MSEDERGQTDLTASDSIPPTDQTHPPADCQPGPGCLGFWFSVWAGTTLAGSIFGHIAAGHVFGFFGGVILAGFFAFPVILSIAVITRFLWLQRFRLAMAGLAGCATGLLATQLSYNKNEYVFALGTALVLAGSFGAFGGFSAAALHRGLFGRNRENEGSASSDRPFTVRDVLVSIVVPIVLISACTYVAWAIYAARQATRKSHCSNNLKQIGLALHNYAQKHRCLPPAYLTDEAGKPVLSWRVCAAEYIYYNLDFSEHVDFSKPWNDPENVEFLDYPKNVFRCPASGKEQDSPLTDYVAVVGPGTLWPGKEPGEFKSGPAVLVVEWPRSDIHWAEPRDVTVEEFLDWFRSKPGRWDSNHSGCLLYVDADGKVGEIPYDADPKTVRKLLAGEKP